jgi:tetratricopeptide (TPR) repeat protein
MASGIVDRAERLFRKGRYTEVARILEPLIVHYRESFRFYRLLGLSCLYANDPGGASTYLRRALQLSPGSLEVKLALAAVDLRRRELRSAVSAYLEILDADPKNRLAALGLDTIRKTEGDDQWAAFIDSGGLKKLYPRDSRQALALSAKIALFIALGCAAAFGLRYAIPIVAERLSATRPGLAPLRLSENERTNPIGATGTASFILTEKEVLKTYDAALSYFASYRDNAAIREANRLINSNAADFMKQKAMTLKGYAREPSFSETKDVPRFYEVLSEPLLYEGCAVIWKGLAANVNRGGETIAFDFLVGYQDKKRLEGIMPSRAQAQAVVEADAPLEILAVIRRDSSGPWLEVRSIHDLSYGKGK